MSLFISLVLALATGAAAYVAKLPAMLGAHPAWAEQVLFIGVPLGIFVAFLTWLIYVPHPVRLFCTISMTGITFAAAHLGMTRFAASYGDDALAGQMWYFGWIAACAFAAATGATVALPTRQPH